VAEEFTKPGVPWRTNIEGWQTYPHLGMTEHGPIVHPVVSNSAQEMINRDECAHNGLLAMPL
jgi:hypothetical protein